MYFSIEDILDVEQIKQRAILRWNGLSLVQRLRESQKYIHIKSGNRSKWVNVFSMLDDWQQNILIKGELIRTYDNMLMSDRKKLTNEAKLSKFESKWYKFTSNDKTKLLKHVLKNDSIRDNRTF